MGRHPVGERAMTATERHRKWLAATIARATTPAPAPLPPVTDSLPPLTGGLPINIDHLRLYPELTAPWLVQRLGPDAARMFYNALGQALGGEQGSTSSR